MSMKKGILLGFEIKTGKKIVINPTHLIVTGITQESGKTTTLETLIKESGLKAIVFKTKIGETGFSEGTIIPPYFRERFDWEYVLNLLQALMKEKLRFQRSWIIRACETADSLIAVKNNIDNTLATQKLGSLDKSILIELQAFFNKVLPQLQYTTFSKTLSLQEGVNIMDLERFSSEVQSLVIQSVLDTVLNEMKAIVIVIPEAWKFLPQGLGNPVKRTAESFIRQGAANRNYLWIDSQDMTGVDKTPLKQVSTWILGYQREINEVKRTLEQIPLPKRSKPRPEEIQSLKLGHFFVTTSSFTKKVYVKPIWLDEKTAKEIAIGKKKVESLKKPEQIVPYAIAPKIKAEIPTIESQKFYAKVQQDLVELRQDFFNKIQQHEEQINKAYEEIFKIQSQKQEINTDEIVSLVLQKMPSQSNINKDVIINEILAKIPRVSAMTTYEVAPLEKLQKGFLEEAKNKILADINKLNEEQKKILKFVETQSKGCNQTQILSKCLFVSATSGGTRQRVSQECKEMANLEIIRIDRNAVAYPHLKERLKELLSLHNAPEQEIEQVYNHILMEML